VKTRVKSLEGANRNYPPYSIAVLVIAGVPVRCLSAAMHMRTHSGYQLQEKDIQDLRRLHERFGIEYPAELAQFRA
jgi:hypothetical protein